MRYPCSLVGAIRLSSSLGERGLFAMALPDIHTTNNLLIIFGDAVDKLGYLRIHEPCQTRSRTIE
jgi:hypothetical protein